MSSENNAKQYGALSPDQLIYLNEEIAGMAKAGLPLEEGLASIAREMTRGNLKQATQNIADEMKRGKSLPDAIAAQQDKLPRFYASLMNAGIRGGNLPDVLAVLTTYARSLADMSAIVVTALLYPAIIVVLAVFLAAIIFVFVMPQFVSIFNEFGMRLPLFSKIIFSICEHPLTTLVLPLSIIGGIFILLKVGFNASERGRCLWTRLIYSLPIFGVLIHSARLAAFTDLLAILIESQMPLPEAFELAAEAGADPLLRSGSLKVSEKLRQGFSLSESLKEVKIFPEVVTWMAGVGEIKGNLSNTLKSAAQMYRRQVEMRSSMVTNIFPPFLIIISAGFITSIFGFAVFIPLFSLLEGLSK